MIEERNLNIFRGNFVFVRGKIKYMQISARNSLKGKIKSVEAGAAAK